MLWTEKLGDWVMAGSLELLFPAVPDSASTIDPVTMRNAIPIDDTSHIIRTEEGRNENLDRTPKVAPSEMPDISPEIRVFENFLPALAKITFKIKIHNTISFADIQLASRSVSRLLTDEWLPRLEEHYSAYSPAYASFNSATFISTCDSCRQFLMACASLLQGEYEDPPQTTPEVTARWKDQLQITLGHLEDIAKLLRQMPLRPYGLTLTVYPGPLNENNQNITIYAGFIDRSEFIRRSFKQWADERGACFRLCESMIPEAETPYEITFIISFIQEVDNSTQTSVATGVTRVIAARIVAQDHYSKTTLLNENFVFNINTSSDGGTEDFYNQGIKLIPHAIEGKLIELLGKEKWLGMLGPNEAIRKRTACLSLTCPRCGYPHLRIANAQSLPCLYCGSDPVTGDSARDIARMGKIDKKLEVSSFLYFLGGFTLLIGIVCYMSESPFWVAALPIIIGMALVVIGLNERITGIKRRNSMKLLMDAKRVKYVCPNKAKENQEVLGKIVGQD